MKISCEQRELQAAIGIVSKAAAAKGPVPAMEGILFEADGDSVKLTAYDGKIGIYTVIDAVVQESGAIVIPAKFLNDLVRKLPSSNVEITADADCGCRILCGKSEVRIMGYKADTFPAMTDVDAAYCVNIPEPLLKSMIVQTIFAVATSEARPTYTGIMFEVCENDLTLVAIDGYRMALRKEEIDDGVPPCKFIIPGSTCAEVERICNAGSLGAVGIALGEKHATFAIGRTVIISRRIEGEFMNYRKSIPTAFEHEITVDSKDLMTAIDRTALVIHDKQNAPIEMTVNDGYLELDCQTTFGQAADSCFCEGDGNGLRIGFNDKYFMDALKAADGDRVKIGMNTASSPIIIQAPDSGKFLYMVLPVRLR